MRWNLIGVAVLLSAFAGCGSIPHPAPVSERPTAVKKNIVKYGDGDWRPATHVVQKGETLYGIALEYGFDYKELAELNAISPPYVIKVGQQLRVAPAKPEAVASAAPLRSASPLSEATPISAVPLSASPNTSLLKTQPKAGKVPYTLEAETAPSAMAPKADVAPTKTASVEEPASTSQSKAAPAAASADRKPTQQAAGDDEDPDWVWPTKGKVIATYNEGANLKGIDIAGKMGQAIFAAAPGKVVYSGSGLRGYGKLVIIKHTKTYLSAYAHNSQILVKEGQSVVKGQHIADMGDTDSDQVKLHFEIRRLGKPVDPLKHLPENNG